MDAATHMRTAAVASRGWGGCVDDATKAEGVTLYHETTSPNSSTGALHKRHRSAKNDEISEHSSPVIISRPVVKHPLYFKKKKTPPNTEAAAASVAAAVRFVQSLFLLLKRNSCAATSNSTHGPSRSHVGTQTPQSQRVRRCCSDFYF